MTLVEVFFASSVLVLLMLSVSGSAFLLNNTKYDTRSNGLITDNARLTMDQMIWGKRVGNGASRMAISEANNFVITSATQLSYRQGANTWHSIRQNGINIEYRNDVNGAWQTIYDPDGPGANDTAHNTTALSFTPSTNPNNVVITLKLGTMHRGRWHNALLSTQVNARNIT